MVNQNPTCCANASVGLPHDMNCPAGGAIAGTAWASGWGTPERREEFDRRAAALRKLHDERKAKDRRERIATAILSGFAAAASARDAEDWRVDAVRLAVIWADALIAELDK